MRKLITMRAALNDPAYFAKTLSDDSWASWRVLLIAIMGEELTDAERVIFKAFTGRDNEPLVAVSEFWGIVGRRGGKTRSMAVLASYLAACIDYRTILAPGERGQLQLLSTTRDQAVALNFIVGVFEGSPNLRGLIANRTSDTISLGNRIDIVVKPASFRSTRGSTAIAVLCDEIAFWRNADDSQNPDKEILRAVRPSLATTGGPLIAISSPYARRGSLWDTYARHYGPTGKPSILVAQGTTQQLNPTISDDYIARQMEEDPEAGAAEYLAQFRTDVEAFISRECIEACIERGVRERAYNPQYQYSAFCDPSAGGADGYTIAICHRQGDFIILDAVREITRTSPESITQEYAALLKQYHIGKVIGDGYAGDFPKEAFARYGIIYELSDKNRSELYLACLPLINSRRVELLDHQKMINQFIGLERRTGRSGRDMINHIANFHDDIANAVAGALVNCVNSGRQLNITAATLARARQPAMPNASGRWNIPTKPRVFGFGDDHE